MKLVRVFILIPLLVIDLYGIVRLIVDMKNKITNFNFGLLFLFIMVIIGGMLIWALIPLLRSDPLLKRGKQAAATILEVWDTGVTINELNIQVGLMLEVYPPNQPSYQVKTKTLVSRIQPTLYQPGMEVQVRYDPKKPKKVVVEGIESRVEANQTGAMRSGAIIYQGRTYTNVEDLPSEARAKYEKAMSGLVDKNGDGIPDILEGVLGGVGGVQAGQSTDDLGVDPAEKLRKLQEMQDEGLITQQEYEAKKAEILSRM